MVESGKAYRLGEGESVSGVDLYCGKPAPVYKFRKCSSCGKEGVYESM